MMWHQPLREEDNEEPSRNLYNSSTKKFRVYRKGKNLYGKDDIKKDYKSREGASDGSGVGQGILFEQRGDVYGYKNLSIY